MIVRAVLLDIDGTLFDTVEARSRFAFSLYGLLITSEISEPAAVFCRRVARECAADATAVLDRYTREIHRFYEPPADLHATLRQLSKLTALGVLSNGSSEVQRRKLAASVPSQDMPFRAVHISGETHLTKPSLRAFTHAAAALGVSCEQVLHIGDDPDADIAGALNAGMQARRVDSPATLPDVLAELCRGGRLG
jgi:putative hydrolase of the HAD superfamily